MAPTKPPRTLLITGTSRGLGRAMAEHFLAAGEQVIGCARSAGDLAHPAYRHETLDVADAAAVGELFTALRREGVALDGLINNAGIARMNAFALSPVESYDAIFATNVRGTLLFCQKALPLLRRAPAPRIVNFSTVAVPLQLAGEALYAASKSAVETLTRIIAQEYGAHGITCNAVGPSPVDTALIAGVPKDKLATLRKRHAVRAAATPADVFNTVEFFLRPESAQVTGQVLYLGGPA
ncbi:MAG: SDR family NAD(P)-dependent oxidoreductase [Pseudohaliea sp.]